MTPVRKKVQRPRPRPDRPPGILLIAMKNPYFRAIVALCVVGILASLFAGCSSSPTPVHPSIDGQPGDHAPPPPDVGDCESTMRSMRAAVVAAQAFSSLIISRDSQYGPAINTALAAVKGALASAEAQCSSGQIDGWAVALAAFDAAFERLAFAGEESIGAATLPNDIQPPPPYAVSLGELHERAYEPELYGRWPDDATVE